MMLPKSSSKSCCYNERNKKGRDQTRSDLSGCFSLELIMATLLCCCWIWFTYNWYWSSYYWVQLGNLITCHCHCTPCTTVLYSALLYHTVLSSFTNYLCASQAYPLSSTISTLMYTMYCSAPRSRQRLTKRCHHVLHTWVWWSGELSKAFWKIIWLFFQNTL